MRGGFPSDSKNKRKRLGGRAGIRVFPPVEKQLQECQIEPASEFGADLGKKADLLEADRDSPPDWELLRKPCSREELAQALARALEAGAGG